MKTESGDPAATENGGAEVHCNGQTANNQKARAPQGVLVQRMTGDIGPLHVLAARGCEAPRVVVETRPSKVRVFIENAPWGWPGGACLQEFLDPASPAIMRHAQRLSIALREKALIEQGRRVRARFIDAEDRHNLLTSRRDGNR